MTPAEAATILRQFNEWRRGDEDIPQFDPREIGEAIDAAVEMIERLEAAEKERDALRNEIAFVKEVEFPRKAQAVADAWEGKCKRLEVERDALRAELDALKTWKAEVEAQKPVGYWDPCDDMYFLPGFLLPHSEAKMEPRYARPVPGAKGEEK